ncbi:hypothetical protein C3E97_028050 [Pseudomonas sp. MWU12-2115]|uniref:hypothetical protein n=1 Tax=unclassified Pseudomonas TaxID=196821 RepID=UPI000CD58BF5|nr:hypothetical protein [Pseudomonas sp. MWU12-2020]RBB97316.1 hypothetical protein C3E97_028050 [Pseudomonas sp. MWU12-2115]
MPIDESDNAQAPAVELVADLLAVIQYLTEGPDVLGHPGRFVAISEEADVSGRVDPVIARAQAFLRAAAGAGE